MSDETWKAIKEAVSMAMSADCECDGALAECVPCRRWSEVQQAIPGLEMMEQERDEARTEAEAFRRHRRGERVGWNYRVMFQPFSFPWENEK